MYVVLLLIFSVFKLFKHSVNKNLFRNFSSLNFEFIYKIEKSLQFIFLSNFELITIKNNLGHFNNINYLF